MHTKKRPVHIDLTKMKFPPMAIVSILHRVSGVFLFLLLPLVLYLFHLSLQSEVSFSMLQDFVASPFITFLLWIFFSAMTFHLFAGIRHMIMDCGFAENVKSGRLTAYLVMALEAIAIILLGVWLWG